MADWSPPRELPDLRRVGLLAADIETRDDGISADRGSAWPWGGGHICGISVAYHADGGVRAHYFPLRHPESETFDPAQVQAWLRDLIASDVRFVTHNGLYDWGWIHTEFDLPPPPSERLEDTSSLATIVDENQHSFRLDNLCAWRGIPGKDETLLRQAVLERFGKTAANKPKEYIWQLPAQFIGPYAEQDAASTLALFESLEPVLDQEGTRGAYRLEIDLLPLCLEMRRRGIRIDTTAAEYARDQFLAKRDAVFAELSDKLGMQVGMEEIGRTAWLVPVFDQHRVTYPNTKKNNPSFAKKWMAGHEHWLPRLITEADKFNNAATKFIENYILEHAVRGRIHAELNPHRIEEVGTRSLRFSYSNPPLQQMPSRDEEMAALIRGVFLPEEGEIWATADASQQEFRLIVHYAAHHKLAKAEEAAQRYREDPSTDFHNLVIELTGLVRTYAKAVNFARAYGASLKKFAEMIGKPLSEARVILDKYDSALPFVAALSTVCEREVYAKGFVTLYDGARRHFNRWAPYGRWEKGLGPCEREEALRRVSDSGHPWYGQKLLRTDVRKAMNARIQGSAARHTKLWMRAAWREGVVPHLQLHDALECSVSSREQAELVARLGSEAVQLEVPMLIDLKFGRTWGDAKHTWEELHSEPSQEPCTCTEALADTSCVEAPVTVASIPFMITQVMKGHLHARGFTEQQIFEMTPQQAHHWLRLETAGASSEEVTIEVSEEKEPAENFADALPQETPPVAPSAEPPPKSTSSPPSSSPPASSSPSASTTRGNGYDHDGSKTAAAHDTYAEEHAGEPFDDAFLHRKGYQLVRVFDYTLADGTPLYRLNRYELWAGFTPSKARPRKRFLPHRKLNGTEVLGAGDRRVIFNWPAIMRAGPGSVVFVTEGESNAKALIDAGLLATTVLSHKWTAECVAALAGHHPIILADNDKDGERLAKDAQRKLAPVAASTRIVPAAHLWKHLPGKQEPGQHNDVADWIALGGDPKKLLDICREIVADGTLESVCAADVEIEDYEWIWPGRFALKKIGLVVGLPDEGKGLFITYAMARITRGQPWPCNEGCSPLGNVILLTAEDDISDTIVPRLIACDADLERVTIIKMMREAGAERMFSLVTDLDALRRKIIEIGNVKMILIDPVSAYLGVGKVDSFRATDVRAILSPLKQLAEELGVAVLGIMHFNKKIDITNVLLRISDSLAYGAASRHVYAIINDPDNHRRLFVRGKNNLADAEQKTLAFHIEARDVGIAKNTGKQVSRPHIVWHPEPVDITATEAMQAAAESKSPSARDNAKHFIEVFLSEGPVDSAEVYEAAKENGISPRTLHRAKTELKIDIKKDGTPNDKGERTWRWHLPSKPQTSTTST